MHSAEDLSKRWWIMCKMASHRLN